MDEVIYENETAEELYERIQREKEKLISEGKLKKQKKLPEISEDEIPFEIPKTWKWVRLGEVFNVIMGQSPKGETINTENNGVEFHQGKIYFDRDYVSESEYFTSNPTKIVEANTVLLCVRAPVGKLNITTRRICIGRGLCGIEGFLNINEKFILYFLRCFENDFIKKSTGSTFTAITGEIIKNQLFPLPPLSEQKRISDLIDRLFEKLDEAKEKALSALNTFELRKVKILHLAIQGKLSKQLDEYGTAEELYEKIQQEKEKLISEGKLKKQKKLSEISEDEIPFEIPKSWKWVRLGEIGDYKKGPFGSALKKSLFVSRGNNTIKVYEQKNAIKKDITLGEYYISHEYFNSSMRAFEIQKNDILVSCAGTIGETYIVPENFEKGIINQALMRIRLSSYINEKYFLIVFEILLKQTTLKDSKGSAMKNIPPFEKLKSYLFPLPSLSEQAKIVKLLDSIFEKEEKSKKIIQATLDKIEIIKKSILNRAVRGRV